MAQWRSHCAISLSEHVVNLPGKSIAVDPHTGPVTPPPKYARGSCPVPVLTVCYKSHFPAESWCQRNHPGYKRESPDNASSAPASDKPEHLPCKKPKTRVSEFEADRKLPVCSLENQVMLAQQEQLLCTNFVESSLGSLHIRMACPLALYGLPFNLFLMKRALSNHSGGTGTQSISSTAIIMTQHHSYSTFPF